MNQELYFCLKLTESEHDIVKNQLTNECERLDCELKYYRVLKDGHVPLYREVKMMGTKAQIGLMKGFLERERLLEFMEKNPYKDKNTDWSDVRLWSSD